MKPWLLSLVMCGALPGSAAAGTLTTTPPLITTAAWTVVCLAQNITAAPVNLDVSILNDSGTTVAETTCDQATGACRAELSGASGVVYCLTDVGKLKRNALVTLMLVDQDGVVRMTMEAHYED